jgi:hypothetical protein
MDPKNNKVKVFRAVQSVLVWLPVYLFGHRITEMKQILSEGSPGQKRRATHF